ncbi:MAG TPA: maltose alpha-D-glucosyltransferase [Polyangia bacterium]|jgi:maltose alpha-D-glucosyltransferase/alpha-amylase|nr:maltose alpha-D-glucosyltransferase [Polyangia bacterium]
MKRARMVSFRRDDRLGSNPLWYKDAVFYELRVRSFFDSNGDGIGDFAGVTSKLDYLQDLGITAIWMLPFYPSPLRDDGYDIADYTDVHPDAGTLADFDCLLEEAHRRKIRIITELVLNHTSDKHPWFRRAREAARGSVEREFYVWSDTPERYSDARIIFKDFEPSNWAWDPVPRAYFWHRFYSHQPDLNFENPAVHEALLAVVDFWMDKGVDGLRLDAVPYLYESEGSNGENLPATHSFLKKLRAHVDTKYRDRMLLAEANQWPEDAASYFGNGDECHMNFHFPIMPRMFMSIHMEDRFPIMDIMAQTPQIPANCQWALFLRNHDELTLEMVTDEERDYMYRAYANDSEMRINLGIRRRLAPLVGNDRRKMELLDGILFSLPGTPVMYYGDEIGMGDNVFLGDRNGVRTPMQWSADRNAGFSRANPQRLILPITIDPEYHYEAVNVEAQQNSPNSLLWWTKRLIALRKQFQAFGRGSIEFCTPSNHRVLAFIRQLDNEAILVVANLSRFVQFVELDLSKWKGMHPVELMGRTELPPIGEAPYLLTLGGHAFYWLSLETPPPEVEAEAVASYRPPTIEVANERSVLHGMDRSALEEALPAFLHTRRWFARRWKDLTGVRIEDAIEWRGVHLLVFRVDFASTEPERFVIPLALVSGGRALPATAVVAVLHSSGGETTLIDAAEDGPTARLLLSNLVERRRISGAATSVEATPFATLEPPDIDPMNISAEHAAAALRYGDRYLLKMFRRVEDGISPELEVTRFLNEHAPALTPLVVGALELRRGRAEPSTLAVLEAYVPNEGTAWTHAREELRRFFERVVTRHRETPPPDTPRRPLDAARVEVPAIVREVIGTYLDTAALLGRRTADLHLALASDHLTPAFRPEPYVVLDRRSKYQSMRNLAGKTLRRLRESMGWLPAAAAAPAQELAANSERILKVLEPLLTQRLTGLRIRTHGDYHLDQVLSTGKDFVIIDFEGRAGETLADRRRKHSAFRDVAGMMRSFHYAALSAILNGAIVRQEDHALAMPWAEAWHRWISAAFLRAYLEGTAGAPFMPAVEDLPRVLEVHLIEKAFLELSDELTSTGDTIAIPLLALVDLIVSN